MTVQGGGSDWTAAIWQTNSAGTAVSPLAGNTYQCVSNGVPFGNNKNNTRIRNPTLPGTVTFPGDSLTLNTNTELRIKLTTVGGTGPILNFPGVGANPGFILNGGVINVGDDTVFVITGKIQVASQSYISPADAGGGAVKPLRGVALAGQLTGTGAMVILQAGTTVPQQIAGVSNTFSGPWIVKAGWLQGSSLNSLGTNSVTIDPNYVLPLDSSIINVAGPAWFEPGYDLNSAGRLILTNGGVMVLHQNCIFSAVVIQGTVLSAGTHYYSELTANFPSSFASGGSGSLTVQPYGPPPAFAPTILTQPASATVYVGGVAQLLVTASGATPLSYQWQKGTNGVFTNATNSGDVSGVRTNLLTFSSVSFADAADYRIVVTNSAGAATSLVATLTAVLPDTNHPTVALLSPAAGAIVNTFTQLQVIFSKNVVGVDPADLLINGNPAEAVFGSGSNYLFSFTQPLPGTILIYWDVENAISDLSGNPLDTTGSWTYTLADNLPPTLLSTAPADSATVSTLAQAQVNFSEPVTGVSAANLLVNGMAAGSVSGSGSGPYTFQFSQPAQGPVQFSWASSQNIRDSAGNPFAPAGWSVTLAPAQATAALTNVVINEFLTANVSTNGLLDEDLALDDWLELYNRGNASVNLAGWSLTTAADNPNLWTFPATNIAPGQYLVIFASEKDRRVPGANLHTNFKLTSAGGYLGLYNGDFPQRVAHEYAPAYPEQRNDISYGLDSANNLRYFAVQTPGGPNSFSTLTGAVAAVHLSVNRGFFNQPFNLVMTTTTPGAFILYTTDGSEPSIAGGFTNGNLCTAPVTISRTTPVRSAAFAPDTVPSLTTSQTYLFVEDIIQQPNNPVGYPTGNVWTPTPDIVQNGSRAYYQMDPTIVNDPQYTNSVRAGLLSIPTCSISMPIPDLFDPNYGIYTHPTNRSTGWERACSMELIFPDGSSGPQIDCGIQIQGGTQRDPAKNAKHSFRVQFKGDYGSSTFDYKMFADSPVQSFKTFVFDGGINYWWNYVGASVPADQRFRAQCVRDQFTSDLMLALGHPSFHGQFYHLYLNGLYWGLHYIHERPDDDYAASYLGGVNTDYDVLKNTTYGLQVVAGDTAAWNTALALSSSGLTNNAQYLQLQQYVDIDNLIDYMIVNHWAGNDDWPQHNWYLIRNRTTGGPFIFIIWDAEHVLKDVTENRTTVNVPGSPAQIYNALRNNAEFRLLYADHLQKLFFNGGLFYADPNPTNALWDPAHPERNIAASYYMRRITEITNAIVDESARWGGYLLTTNYTRNYQWLQELNNLLGFTNIPVNSANYFPLRSANVLNQYRAIGLFPSVNAPVFNQTGGIVPVGFSVTVTNPNTGGVTYYTTNGVDPRVFGSGAVALSVLPWTNGTSLVLNSSTAIKARVLNGSWSPLVEADFTTALLGIPIRITEIMYNPVGGAAYKYIEIQNIGLTPVDMSGFSFAGVTYVFPNGTILAPGAVMVIASGTNPSAFVTRYPGVAVAGYYSGGLSSSGERLALLDQNGNTIVAVNYQASGGWPTAPNGGGYSLEIINPNGDPDDPANWRASLALNGSPGIPNLPATLPAIRFNEAMAENAGLITNGTTTNSDWLELYNAGTNAVSLANWSLSNSGNARKYLFPTGTTIAAGGYLVVWCDSQTNAPGLHSGFTLGRKGENLFLYDTLTNRIDAFSFGLQLTNYSVGRIGPSGSWQLNLPTPGANNIAAPIGGAANLVLNEWLANSVPGGSDWLEIFNNSSSLPVPLAGLYLATSNALFEIRSLSFIAPHDFVQLYADENPGFDHLDFKLTAAGDAIILSDYSGGQIDRVNFTNQVQGVSQGRYPDGSSNIVSFPGSTSPGASNYLLAWSGPVLNELMAKNVASVYDPRGNNPDWLELYNPSASAFSLAGLSLSTDQNNPAQWVFPPGVSIAPNGYLLVWCDPTRSGSTNVVPDLNTGFPLSAEGATLSLYNTNGQLADSITCGPQIADLSIGRSAGTWVLLAQPTPGAANALPAALGDPTNLRVNEWMAAPASGNDWFELYNTDPAPISLTGLYLTDDPSISGMTKFIVGPLSYVAGHGWVEFHADGSPSQGPSHVNFSLSKDGEPVRIYNTNLTLIDAADFGLQATGVSQGRLPDGGTNLVSFINTPTPDASNYLPLQNVLVNEVLTHTDPPLEDAIELYNPCTSAVALDGWFISNSETEFKKYQIPPGTTLPAHGYKVFYQYQFDSTNASPFTLNSAHGDSVFVSQADGSGNLTGYRAQVTFGAAPNGVSFGRFVTSAGVDFVPMAARTFGVDNPSSLTQFRTGTGLTNSYPKVGPVVINELMYHPITVSGTNISENTDEEFIELFNMTSTNMPLYDPATTTNHWKLDGGVSYFFPANVTMPPGSYLVVVAFDPNTNSAALANFRTKYNVATNVALYGPYAGKLDDSGETIQLYKPDSPQTPPHPDAGFVPYILVDTVSYSNASPWPAGASGTGLSLQRTFLGSYGNEPLHWLACTPNPGTRNCVNDTDADGLPDDWELANGLNPLSASGNDGASGDPDGDHFTNLQEYLAGTNPRDPASYLKFNSISPIRGGVALGFTAVAGHSYTIQSRDTLATGPWQRLADVPPPVTNSATFVNDLPGASHSSRYYRLVTPMLP
jgi:hypothetical protein